MAYAQKLAKIARVVTEISSRTGRQTDTHRRTHHNNSQPLPRPAGEVISSYSVFHIAQRMNTLTESSASAEWAVVVAS